MNFPIFGGVLRWPIGLHGPQACRLRYNLILLPNSNNKVKIFNSSV